MLSGIGPADHLREHGIEVRVDAPAVGTNLQEHAYGVMSYATTAGTLAEELLPLRALKHAVDFALRGRGALTVSGAAALVFSQITGAQPTEVEIILMPIRVSFKADADGDDTQHDIHDVNVHPHGLMLYPGCVHPVGRGTVRLVSSDPSATPAIEHELVSPDDMTGLIAACRQAREIFHTPVMKAKAVTEELPGDGVQTDEQWTDYLRNHAFRADHPVGTCRMGSDDSAVVDPHLRVRGVQGLRVVDASIFPTITSGNTNAPVIMVAERAADLILHSSTTQ
jgi:choline dehydrogenase-like flavoprotein